MLKPLIQKYLKHIDFLAVDLRHFNLNLGEILKNISLEDVRIIMHYNQTMAFYKRETFDLIVLDIQMAEIDGVELLEMMRGENAQDKTSTIALTANILNNEEQRLLELGFDYYLGKPIDEEKFCHILDRSTHMNGHITELKKSKSIGQTVSISNAFI